MAYSVKPGVPGEIELTRAEKAIEDFWEDVRKDLDLEGTLEENYLTNITEDWNGEYGELRLPGERYTGKVVSDSEGNLSYELEEHEGPAFLRNFETFQPDYTKRDEFLEEVKDEFGYGTRFSVEDKL